MTSTQPASVVSSSSSEATSDPSPDPAAGSSAGLPFVIPRRRELVRGRLVRRYKRFLADVELDDGRQVTAHSANTGAMEGLTAPGLPVWLAPADNPKRKLRWDWELVERDGRLYGAHTGLPNKIVGQLLEARALPAFADWDELAAERRYGDGSRVDFWMRRGEKETFLEVKNCHLVYPDERAYFPDAVSERAVKHLEELAAVVEEGQRAQVLFVCQVGTVEAVRPSDVHHPEFAATARRVAAAGVGFSGLMVSHTPEAITVEATVPVDLEPYDTEPVVAYRDELRRAVEAAEESA